jgi:hypothetical protein
MRAIGRHGATESLKTKEIIMTDETQTKTGRKPTHSVSTVRESGNGKSYWTRIGAGWTNKDGSISIQIEAVPLDGRLIVQVNADEPKPE